MISVLRLGYTLQQSIAIINNLIQSYSNKQSRNRQLNDNIL